VNILRESVRLIPAEEDREWARWLDPVPHDFYHTAAYHRFSEGAGEGTAFLAVCGAPERYLAWPYLLRPVEDNLHDVTSVYGYAGPLAHGCSADHPFLETAHRRIADLWRSQRVISVFTRFHPLLENHRWGRWAAEPGMVKPGGETVSLDLTLAEADHWQRYRRSLRHEVLRARRLGLRTEVDESWRYLPDFVRLYQQTMTRNRAAPLYFFPAGYFERLKAALGGRIFLLITKRQQAVAAAGILTEHRGIVQDHFCASEDEFLDLAPSKILLDDARRWAQGRGNRVMHLGGGRGGARDSLYAFKTGFSPRRHLFYTGRWILEPKLYSRLSAGPADPGADFFPAYREARHWAAAGVSGSQTT